MNTNERIIDHLDFDEVWENKEESWEYWGERIDAHPVAIADALRDKGWVREDGKLVQAQCAICFKIFNAEDLNEDRECYGCYNPDREFYEQELKKFLRRHPFQRSRVKRSL